MPTTMTMDIMRARFRSRVAGLADSFTDEEVDDYLYYAHDFMIPSRIPGFITDGTWSQATTDGDDEYRISGVYSLDPRVYVDGDEITTYTRLEDWRADHDPEGTDTGKPDAAMIYGTARVAGTDATWGWTPAVTVYPIPDATVYTLSGGARIRVAMNLVGGQGLLNWQNMSVNTPLLKSMLAGAAHEFALDEGEDSLAEREGLRFTALMRDLRAQSLTPAQAPSDSRTF